MAQNGDACCTSVAWHYESPGDQPRLITAYPTA